MPGIKGRVREGYRCAGYGCAIKGKLFGILSAELQRFIETDIQQKTMQVSAKNSVSVAHLSSYCGAEKHCRAVKLSW